MSLLMHSSASSINKVFNRFAHHSCRVLVVGGGAGGCAVAAKLSKVLKKNEVILLDPSEKHYYQPLFTLVGGGIYSLDKSFKFQKDVLPKNALWIQDGVSEFQPKNNTVRTSQGKEIKYDFMLLAVGLETNYDKIPGLLEGMKNHPNVCSNYSAEYVEKTYQALKKVESGNAIFTYPDGPVKCPGAPQKICYITEDYLTKKGKRDRVNIIYNTSLPVIFGVEKYANALWGVVKRRGIQVNLRTNLIEVRPDKNEAVFVNLDKPEEKKIFNYSMLHVTPPMSTPEVLRNNKELSNPAGFADVDTQSLRHNKFPNVFAIGDCSSTPNSKTAAAAAAQSVVVFRNIDASMKGLELKDIYDGYASCPLVTGINKCILAEFDYKLQPLETFPISQDKEMMSMYLLKKLCMPTLYWNLMLTGNWNGPAGMRKLLHLGLK